MEENIWTNNCMGAIPDAWNILPSQANNKFIVWTMPHCTHMLIASSHQHHIIHTLIIQIYHNNMRTHRIVLWIDGMVDERFSKSSIKWSTYKLFIRTLRNSISLSLSILSTQTHTHSRNNKNHEEKKMKTISELRKKKMI